MPKDEPLHFQGLICGYSVTIISTKDTIQLHYYQSHLPHIIYQANFFKAIEGSTNPEAATKILQLFNRSFKRFLKYIIDYSEDQQRINIGSAGYVTITYFTSLTKPKKAQIIQFDGMRMMSQGQIKVEKEVRSKVIDVRAQNVFLREVVMKMEREFQEQGRLMQELRREVLGKKKEYLRELKGDARKWEKEEDCLRNNSKYAVRKQLAQSISSLKDLLKQMMAQADRQPAKLPQLAFDPTEAQYDDLQKYGQKHWVVIDLNNKYLQDDFIVQGYSLTKVGMVFNSVQVLGRDPFPTQGRHYFTLYICKITASIFSVGIVSQSRRNFKSSYDSSQCIVFYGRNGTIWQDTIQRGGGPMIPNNVQIRVVLDWLKQMIKWYQDGIEIGSTMLSQHFRGKRLVPYIQMSYPGDKVVFNQWSKEEIGKEIVKRKK